MFQVPPVDPRQQVERLRALARQSHDRAIRGARVGMFIGGLSFLVVGVGATIAAIAAALDADDALGPVLGAGLFGLCFLLGAGLFFGLASSLGRRESLRTRGVPTQVRIIEVLPKGLGMRVSSGGSSNYLTQSVLRLEVLLPGGGSTVVVHREFAPAAAREALQPGAVIQAFMAPNNPKKLLLDWPS